MNTGIELVLARMETHPEEFVGVNGGCSKEWYVVMTPVIPYLTDDEKKALESALKRAHLDHFNAQVMKKIAGEEVLSDRQKGYIDDHYGRSLVDLVTNSNNTEGVTLQSAPALVPMKNHVLRGSTQPSAFGAVPKAEGAMIGSS